MGACLSGAGGKSLIQGVDGNEEAYHSRYLEDKVLGEGQFGVVKLVHDMQTERSEGGSNAVCASKQLRKGVVFKDNTLYTPLKPEVLQAECDILRTLAGEKFCLKLVGIYESRSIIWMVTELCQGGEMMEYVAARDELRTEDVSRIAFQMLSAVDHCAKHGILHRDIKPENTMFVSTAPDSELRLIDFGSGCLDDKSKAAGRVAPPEQSEFELQQHTTFAGTAFYISPEMFQRKYTSKTDVWSVGVCLYVLVAGYPSDVLQRAFNMLQKSKRNLRDLPHMPKDVPDTYIELLDQLLVYRHKERKSAGWALKNSEFVHFHQQLEKEGLDVAEVAAEAASAVPSMTGKPGSMRRTQSINLSGSVKRHSIFVDYKAFERSVTSLLASMLQPKSLDTLLEQIVKKSQTEEEEDSEGHKSKLQVVQIKDLRIMLDELKHTEVLERMSQLPNAMVYNTYSYHWKLLKDFQGRPTSMKGGRAYNRFTSTSSVPSSVHGNRVFRAASVSLRGQEKQRNSSWHGGVGGGQFQRANSTL